MITTETIYFKKRIKDPDNIDVKPHATDLAKINCFPKVVKVTDHEFIIKTGRTSNPERAKEIIAICKKHGFMILDRKIHKTKIRRNLINVNRSPIKQNGPFGHRPRRRRRIF